MLGDQTQGGIPRAAARYLEEWHEAGVGDRLHRTMLDGLGKADRIDKWRARLAVNRHGLLKVRYEGRARPTSLL